MKHRTTILLLSTLHVMQACGVSQPADSSDEALDAVRTTAEAYVDGWLQDDTTAVMETLTHDAVLMPQGRGPIRGSAAIRDFWWPSEGPATRITRYADTIDEIGASGNMAFVRGTAEFTFEWDNGDEVEEQSSRSAYLMVLRTDSVGGWKISHRMWGRAPD